MQRGFRLTVPRGYSRCAPGSAVLINLIKLCFFYIGGGASHQRGWIAIGRTREVDRDLAIVTLQLPEARSDGVEGLWKNSTIATRSSRDRGAIEPRSRGLGRENWADSFPIDRPVIEEALTPRSTPDRDPIVARSWRKSRRKRGKSEAKLKLNTSRFVAELKPQPRPKESPPRRQQTASTIVSITHDFKPNFPFKTMYSLLLFFNFWSTREEIKRVSRKVLSSRDPLLPRV